MLSFLKFISLAAKSIDGDKIGLYSDILILYYFICCSPQIYYFAFVGLNKDSWFSPTAVLCLIQSL